ncbi:MAG TPA: cob(I)yrinic acid a,c-diamide adenosyltransferase, partial [Thermoplasmatales archaeon]|nr:cob(I)yrinic acid a,c-diamide adenosyltransferase [Thermoplasmatales archaeon]
MSASLHKDEKGRVIVFTGEGQGKTTAALGIALRSAAHGKRVVII